MRLLPILAASLFILVAPALKAQSTDFPELTACSQAIVADKDGAKQADLCKAAVQSSPGHPIKDRMLAWEYAATAFRRNRQFEHAIDFANHAVDHANKLHLDDATTASAYLVLAQCYESHKEEMPADDAARSAVEHQREAYKVAAPADRPAAAASLQGMLRYRARLLKDLHRDGDSIACLDEASKL